jgi:hypothetical protein
MTLEQLPAQETLSTEIYAPVVHVAGDQKNLVVDVPYGSGTIVFLTDPYVVSNAGIGVVDNAQLALNLVVPREGTIAFDEYHQGYGSNNNRLLGYFAGTPMTAILLQAALLIMLIFYSQGRRFARPLPDKGPDRLSKLEYVTAMAELQRRSKAFDLAIENIYTDFRRRAARSLGLDNTTATRAELAERIAERTGRDSGEIDRLMYRCEDVIHGEPIRAGDAVKLASALREIEELLGLGRARQGGRAPR